MLAFPADLYKVRARADHIGQHRLGVELLAQLVEVRHRLAGAPSHLTGIRREFAKQQLEQRGLARAVRADNANAVAAQDSGREARHNRSAIVMLGDLKHLHHHATAALTLVDLQACLPDPFPTYRAFTAQRLQPSHPALVTSTTGFDALADPHLFLRQQLVKAGIGLFFGIQHVRLAALVIGEVAIKAGQLAPVQFNDPGSHVVKKDAIVRDDHHGTGKIPDQLFQPFDAVEVKVIGGLVQQQQLGVTDQRARQ